MNAPSIFKYIQRQDNARLIKEKTKLKIENMGGGKDWKNKVTRPITPQVLKGYKDRLPVDESIKWNQN